MFLQNVEVEWARPPPLLSCTLLGQLEEPDAACTEGNGTLVKKLRSGRPLAGEAPATTLPPSVDEALNSYRSKLLHNHTTYDLSQVSPLHQLPVLTSSNADEYPEWHAYIESIYGDSPPFPVVLDTFNWFYWTAPLRLEAIYLCDWSDSYPEAPYGTPWTGGLGAWSWGPEHMVRRAGFFVHREPNIDMNDERLEVMRIGPIDYEGFEESRYAWFFHAIGSGIYVRPTDVFTRVDMRYERHMAVPRVELIGWLPQTTMLGARSRPAAMWPASLRFELFDASPCESTSLERRILSCANMPMPFWAAEDDPQPASPLPSECVHDTTEPQHFTSYPLDCTGRLLPSLMPPSARSPSLPQSPLSSGKLLPDNAKTPMTVLLLTVVFFCGLFLAALRHQRCLGWRRTFDRLVHQQEEARQDNADSCIQTTTTLAQTAEEVELEQPFQQHSALALRQSGGYWQKRGVRFVAIRAIREL